MTKYKYQLHLEELRKEQRRLLAAADRLGLFSLEVYDVVREELEAWIAPVDDRPWGSVVRDLPERD